MYRTFAFLEAQSLLARKKALFASDRALAISLQTETLAGDIWLRPLLVWQGFAFLGLREPPPFLASDPRAFLRRPRSFGALDLVVPFLASQLQGDAAKRAAFHLFHESFLLL